MALLTTDKAEVIKQTQPISPSANNTSVTPNNNASVSAPTYETQTVTKNTSQLDSIDRDLNKWTKLLKDLYSGKVKTSQRDRMIEQAKANIKKLNEQRNNLIRTGTAYTTETVTIEVPATTTPTSKIEGNTVTVEGKGYSVAPSLQEQFIVNKERKALVDNFTPTKFRAPRTISASESMTPTQIREYQSEQDIKSVAAVQETEERLLNKQKSSFKDGQVKVFAGTTTALFLLGAGRGVTNAPYVISPVSPEGKAQIPVITPTLKFGEYLATGEYIKDVVRNPAGTVGEFAGAYVTLSKTPLKEVASKEVKIVSDIVNKNPYAKQSVVFSASDVVGKKGVTPIERKAVFEPKLEKVNAIETDYGIMEVETRQERAPIVTEDKILSSEIKEKKTIKIEPEVKEETISEDIGEVNIKSYSELFNTDLKGKSNSMAGTTQSLAGRGASLGLLQEQKIIYEVEQRGEITTIYDIELMKDTRGKVTNTLPLTVQLTKQDNKVLQQPTQIFKTETRQEPKIDLQQEYKTNTITETKIVPRQETKQSIKQVVEPIVRQEQKQDLFQAPITSTRQRIEQKLTTYKVTETKIQKPITPINPPKKEQPFRSQLFTTQVREKGQFKSIGTFSSMSEAFNRGKQYVERTASATFKIQSGGQAIKPSGLLPKGFYKSKLGITQERSERIKSLGEKLEISAKGRQVQKARAQFKKNNRRVF